MELVINNRKYGYTIEPHYDKVRVEIYKVLEPVINMSERPVHIHLLSKSFGRWFRKPIKTDYDKAKIWAEEQMELIKESNS